MNLKFGTFFLAGSWSNGRALKQLLVGCNFGGWERGNKVTSSHSIKSSFPNVSGKRLAMLCPAPLRQTADRSCSKGRSLKIQRCRHTIAGQSLATTYQGKMRALEAYI